MSLLVRGNRWRDVGLNVPPNWQRLVLIGLAAGIAMELLELFGTQPLLVLLTGTYPDLSDLHDLIGDVDLLLAAVAASWLLVGVGEEVVWRGYILNRLTDLWGQSRLGWLAAIGPSSVVFGFATHVSGRRRHHRKVDSLISFSVHYPGMH